MNIINKSNLRFFLLTRFPFIINFLNYIKYKQFDLFNIIEIETITACNRKCTYCPNSKYERSLLKNTKKINPDIFHKIIDQLAEIRFSGNIHPHFYGEPLLDDRLFKLLKYSKDKLNYALILIFTNGELLSFELYEKFSNLNVGFVISTHSPDIKDKIKIIQNKFKEKYGYNKKNILWNKINDKTKLNNRSNEIQLKNIKYRRKCNWPSFFCIINYKGEVILCCNDYHSRVVLGSLKKENLLAIWNKEEFKQLRKDIKKGNFKYDLCIKCGWGEINDKK